MDGRQCEQGVLDGVVTSMERPAGVCSDHSPAMSLELLLEHLAGVSRVSGNANAVSLMLLEVPAGAQPQLHAPVAHLVDGC